MNLRPLLILMLAGFIFGGCYTQLQTIERSPSSQSDGPYLSGDQRSGMYDEYYDDDLYSAYNQGYNDGLFDADIAFRSYDPHRFQSNLGFNWGRSFMGFGYSYGHYYDPYWHYAQLFDPYYYSSYGYYAAPFYMRYRHYGHFYSPFYGPNTVIVYNNYGSSSGPDYRGPRQSGVHRGNVTSSRQNRLVSRGTSAGDTRTRLRGMGVGSFTEGVSRGTIRTRSGYVPTRSSVERRRVRTGSTSRGTVERRRATPPRSTSRTSPQRRGSSSSGSVGRTRGSSSSKGSSGRSRSSGSSSSSERKRGGDDGISLIQPMLQQQHSYEIVQLTNINDLI